jgi:hypothetical protein
LLERFKKRWKAVVVDDIISVLQSTATYVEAEE